MSNRMPPLIRIAKMTYSKLLQVGGRLRLKNECGADLKSGPYLLLLNHVGIMDPVMVSSVMPRHIRWVAGAYLFKTWFLKFIIGKCCTAIPKQQGRQDISTFRNIQRILKEGDNVGLFPEGTRTWDGEMMPVSYLSLAKLLRLYKVPVLFVHLEGGFAHQPRWADYKRRGKVVVNVKYLLTPQQMAQMEVPDLAQTIEKYLHFSNDEWKETVDYDYKSPKRAEGLQRLLYMCPSCNGIDSHATQGNKITCRSCGATTILDEMDNLTSIDTPFKRLSQWHSWEAQRIGEVSQLPEERGVLLQRGDSNHDVDLETLSKDFSVQLKNDTIHIRFASASDKDLSLPLEKISSMILNAKQTMELFCEDVLYRIRLLPDSSSLKYHEYYLAFKKRKEKES